MSNSRDTDPIWQAALDWVLTPPEPGGAARLQDWLASDPAHRQAYEEARRAWLLTGLLPPGAGDPE